METLNTKKYHKEPKKNIKVPKKNKKKKKETKEGPVITHGD